MATPTTPAPHQFDLIVLGFGKAGKTLAMQRARAGERVALVEQSPTMFGGTCINIGCVPTKTLLHSMSATEALREAGVDVDDTAAHADAVARRNALIAKMNAANASMAENAGVTLIVGRGSFLDGHTLRVEASQEQAPAGEELLITAPTIIINTGARPVWPNLPGIDGPGVYDSTTIQQITRPKHLIIVGGGPIGLEFATLFSGFGTTVTILDAGPRPLGKVDEDIAAMAADLLRARGVTFVNGARAQAFAHHPADGTVTVTYTVGGPGDSSTTDTVTGDAVLVAIGRRPATEGLNLAAAGIATTERGAIVVDEHLRTTAPGVYAAGDVTGGPQFTYASFDDHRVILHDRYGVGAPRVTTGRLLPTTTFLEPPLATVGATREELTDRIAAGEVSDRTVTIADVPILPRPKIVGHPEGMARLLVDTTTDAILGATLLCIDAQELINTVAVAMRAGMTAAEFTSGIYTHPATSEVFNALG
ncbi:pyridine nucleotide-disulfide oxidoreductase [Corynebacterium sp. 13CS0277]|uniref:dihydrolipoyl dehydrogenase family protein n=1 Tax=Corynebacterium sp. 13CS0277 TaxID=2071994 RepID=UPI000D0252B9|nr:NAD(P)/FAD-dependent oxidoreductase [Corynebacterium sp. 13CS0277]PRQ10454.1 pyridine nucleotide-disulfide oxidoreductase [Corynebacterium sp. 13CS0277]